MSEAMSESQLRIKMAPNRRELSKKNEPQRDKYYPSVNGRLQPTPVSKEVIIRLIKFIEQL
jgi:hypothetical protein